MNREVNLTKRVQAPYGWRYCRLVFSANGRIKADLAVVNGKQECHKEGAYYLGWREGSKRVRLSSTINTDFGAAGVTEHHPDRLRRSFQTKLRCREEPRGLLRFEGTCSFSNNQNALCRCHEYRGVPFGHEEITSRVLRLRVL